MGSIEIQIKNIWFRFLFEKTIFEFWRAKNAMNELKENQEKKKYSNAKWNERNEKEKSVKSISFSFIFDTYANNCI